MYNKVFMSFSSTLNVGYASLSFIWKKYSKACSAGNTKPQSG